MSFNTHLDGRIELKKTPILDRYAPSQADVHVFKAISSDPDVNAVPHVTRWYTHIKSYAAEHASLPGSSTAGEPFLGGADAKAEGDDDEIDLFGSDEEEDAEAEKIKAQRVAEYNAKKANKAKPVAKVFNAELIIHTDAHIMKSLSLR
jgi:elongation factor 1-beta